VFFDDHPEFLETSSTASSKSRLNLRHLGVIKENEEILRGRSVVDIASHDGRWCYAALDVGATHVTGLEGRRRLIDNTKQTFDAKGVPATQYTLIQGDVHETLFNPEVEGDVVLCLGFLYHTARYVELMSGIRSTGAEYVIVDTRVLQDVEGPLIEMRTESVVGEAFAMKDRYTIRNRTISAVPSEAAVVLMLQSIGYEVDHRTDWTGLIAQYPDAPGVIQYTNGKRVTFRARKLHRPGTGVQVVEDPLQVSQNGR
jgi:hypothetical protein